MSKKNGIDAFSRRAFLRSAATFGAAAWAGAAGAQDALNEIINSPRRGSWDDQFDAKASRTATAVLSNTPVFGPETIAHLQQAIFDYQQIASAGGWPMVTPASTQRLEIGVTDPSVQQLRQRLMISGDLPHSAGISSSFDSYVDGAVKRFQARHGLPADGVIGEYSLKAMNVDASTRLAQLETNLVRLQSMSGDLGRRYVMVNIPAAYIEAVENGRVALRHTAIVGKIDRQSPILNSKIYEVILNPYWTAPRSIIQKDIMPLMRKDPTYLARNAIRLLDGNGNEVSPETIDWQAEKAPNLMFRQDPGKINAMSSTKINFHNEHAVYMHDTPQQGLFNKLMRFESSGCVRVQNVRDLSTWLLKETPGWARQQIEATIKSGVNTPIKLAEEVPVYFTYITAWSAKDRVVQFRDDIYQRDGAAELALQTTTGIEQSAGPIDADALPQ
ncbi:murein L,D-transpeptidase [Sinorhizobium meliloti]|uniref:Peptidoglycan binding domain-containing protein n=1 Tax=Sinorhizobium meliloti (strain SM11) TaxID=707241 RepID=F7X4C4_SINMM|nr:murein L,D-transpeptidase [Sinorhizobium meliloti]AEH79710.1 peptidoglycan binding domain-containing protein [Sinorhizobium meliloti SM11]ARS72586.1 murein L,D-transpeptidase [Sinorhizobium meliloti RU11/001]MDE3791515.1 murein L,D-transpeptidase [Sinorhizobium meliloti]MDE4557428.1 murein L,D-transpeptidase [Sinorhizobium meliloti SM11]RVG66562.1 murein L,D-transpeptidase [Sinorhizobium meliloti]